ncbi:MAG: hypothetical protein ACKVP3_22575 [Hyphomicrobiaceae bacterium]
MGRWRALAVLAVLLECAWPARAEDRSGVLRGPLLEEPTPPPRSRRERVRKEQAADIETGAIGREAAKPLVAPDRETAVLRGTLSEDKGTTAISVGFAAGYTTNAGPSLDKRDSGVTRTTAEMLHVLERDGQQVSLKGEFADRRYIDRPDASEMQYAVSAAYGGTLKTGVQVSASLRTERRVDVDESVYETAMSVGYEWPKAALTPFAQVMGAYLDYGAIAGNFLEFGNQDDRDRVSGTAQAGLKYDIASKLVLRFGAGADIKRYTLSHDDFGLMRDSTSVFPFVGLSYADGDDTADLVYAQVYRSYREAEFSPLLAHTVAARAQMKVDSALKLFGGLRMGLEETDFFIAKTIQEYAVSVGGVVTTAGGASAGVEVTYTLSDFLGFDRVDHKLEATLKAKTPVSERFFLTGEAKYLDFKTNFADARTDMLMGMVGVAYEYGK